MAAVLTFAARALDTLVVALIFVAFG